MEQEHVDTEDKALEYVARMADGSMRDALSLLDQCIAFYLGEKLTYDNVLEVLGTVDIQVYSDLLDMILSQDINGVMDLLEDVARQGREWSQFITDFLWYLRNLLLVGQGNAAEEALEVSTDQLKLLQEKAQQVEENTLIRYIRILSELLERIRYATSKRVLVEVEMMKMCRPQMEAHKQSGRQGETVRTAVRTVATVRNFSTAGGTSGTKSNSTATGSKIRTRSCRTVK